MDHVQSLVKSKNITLNVFTPIYFQLPNFYFSLALVINCFFNNFNEVSSKKDVAVDFLDKLSLQLFINLIILHQENK